MFDRFCCGHLDGFIRDSFAIVELSRFIFGVCVSHVDIAVDFIILSFPFHLIHIPVFVNDSPPAIHFALVEPLTFLPIDVRRKVIMSDVVFESSELLLQLFLVHVVEYALTAVARLVLAEYHNLVVDLRFVLERDLEEIPHEAADAVAVVHEQHVQPLRKAIGEDVEHVLELVVVLHNFTARVHDDVPLFDLSWQQEELDHEVQKVKHRFHDEVLGHGFTALHHVDDVYDDVGPEVVVSSEGVDDAFVQEVDELLGRRRQWVGEKALSEVSVLFQGHNCFLRGIAVVQQEPNDIAFRNELLRFGLQLRVNIRDRLVLQLSEEDCALEKTAVRLRRRGQGRRGKIQVGFFGNELLVSE